MNRYNKFFVEFTNFLYVLSFPHIFLLLFHSLLYVHAYLFHLCSCFVYICIIRASTRLQFNIINLRDFTYSISKFLLVTLKAFWSVIFLVPDTIFVFFIWYHRYRRNLLHHIFRLLYLLRVPCEKHSCVRQKKYLIMSNHTLYHINLS